MDNLRSFHLFAGGGGGILSDVLLGHLPVGACEIDEDARNILLQRQRDNVIPSFPIWDEIATLDGTSWRGHVDVLCGGFPCQDISAQGANHGAKQGIDGDRSGLWSEYCRLIGEMQPKFVFAENSPLLRTRGLVRVLKDLASLGYDARWCRLGGSIVGADHQRKTHLDCCLPPLATDWKGGSTAIRKDKGRQRFDQWRDYVKIKFGMTYPHPTHSELRMGWPEGWTELAPLATVKFQQWRALHGSCSPTDSWKKVSYAADCIKLDPSDDEGEECSLCGDFYPDCPCPGPTQEGYEYAEIDGELYARVFVESGDHHQP